MIIEIPNDNSIVKWKNEDKDEWKTAEISDLIKAYESDNELKGKIESYKNAYKIMSDAFENEVRKNQRPQGEWEESHIFSCGKILRMQLDVIEHKCKNCGRWSIKWVRTIPDNFCSYCGASIKEAKKND